MKKLFFFLVVLFLPFMINAKELKLDNVVLRNKTDARVLQVLKANDGNYVITSLQRNISADGGVSTVEKRDTNGHLMWEVVYGVSSDSSMIEFSSMAIASDDSIIIAGYFNETDDIEFYDDKTKLGFMDRFKIHNGGQSSLLTVKGGRVVVAKKCNDIAVRRDLLVERFVNDADLREHSMIVYNEESPFEAQALMEVLKRKSGVTDIDIVEASRVTGSHIRPYSLGLAYKTK